MGVISTEDFLFVADNLCSEVFNIKEKKIALKLIFNFFKCFQNAN